MEVCSGCCSHTGLNAAPPSWCPNCTKSPMSPTHKKMQMGKKLPQKYLCNMPRNMTAKNTVNVNCYYTHNKKIKFINVRTVPFVCISISQKTDVQGFNLKVNR